MSLFPPPSLFSESSNTSFEDATRKASIDFSSLQPGFHDNSSVSTDISTPSISSSSPCSSDSDQSSDKIKRKSNYKRYPKPPYTYAGMIIMSIQMSPDKRLSLAEIHQSLVNMFPFFRGSYKGWKYSVRHILSSCSCFYRCLSGYTNKWAVNLNLAQQNTLRRQNTDVTRVQHWAPTICEYLGVPEVVIPAKQQYIDHSHIVSESMTNEQPACIKTHQPSNNAQQRLSDFSIERILTPEIADESRPLDTFEMSPTINKMSLKMITRKATANRHINPSLSRLITDSATKWGVSEEVAVNQLRALCQVINVNNQGQQGTQPVSHSSQSNSQDMFSAPLSQQDQSQLISTSTATNCYQQHYAQDQRLSYQDRFAADQYYTNQQAASYNPQQLTAHQVQQQCYSTQQYAAEQYTAKQYATQQFTAQQYTTSHDSYQQHLMYSDYYQQPTSYHHANQIFIPHDTVHTTDTTNALDLSTRSDCC